MAKPIKLTAEIIELAVKEFREKLSKLKSVNGSVDYKAELKAVAKQKTKLVLTETAYYKTRALIDGFSGEVGWYGLAKRTDDGFEVYDIIVYPQEVTGVTVTTDEKELGKWYDSLSDEVFNAKRFHGHSHVNFAPSPSETDISDRDEKLKDLSGDDFFIFMIINKEMKYTCEIFDLAANVHYENGDVQVLFPKSCADFFDSMKNVRQKTYTYSQYSGYKDYQSPVAYQQEYKVPQYNNAASGLTVKDMRAKARKYNSYTDYYDEFMEKYGGEDL